MTNYAKLRFASLLKICSLNPPDTPHWQKAHAEITRRYQRLMVVIAIVGMVVTVARFLR